MNIADELRAQANQHPLDADLTMFDVAASKIEEQQAHIERLREAASDYLHYTDDCSSPSLYIAARDYLDEVLNETPAQSLEALSKERNND